MRLNGKKAIMEYLGRTTGNWRAWQGIRLRYGRVIYILDGKRHHPRYWTTTEWLNQVDLDTGKSVYDLECAELAAVVPTQTYAEREAKGMIRRKRELVTV